MLIALVFICVSAASASEIKFEQVVVGVEVGLLKEGRRAKIKLTNEPLNIDEAHQIDHIVWTTNEAETQDAIYCVSKTPSKLMRFGCLDCELFNVTDIIEVLNTANDMTEETGFPTIALKNMPASIMNINWTGLRVVCQAGSNGTEEIGSEIEDSEPAVIEVRLATFEKPRVFTVEPSGYT